MNKIAVILGIILLCIAGCKKTDKNTAAATKNKKAPVKYLRLNGVDGELILSTASENLLDSVNHVGTIAIDSLITYNQEEIFGYFPGDGASSPLLGAGNIFFNGHQVYEAGTDSSYYLQTAVDTFNFDTTTVFTSNWAILGGEFPGFTENCPTNQFPAAFHFQLDTALHKSINYVINLNPGGGIISNTDSIVYMMYNFLNSTNAVIKVFPAGIQSCTFLPGDLSVFASNTLICISVIAYNYRHEVIGGHDIYFVNMRRFDNNAVAVRP